MNQQIEELRKDICNIPSACNVEKFDDCEAKDGSCYICRTMARDLYNMGYRKQSEGKWIVIPDEYEICATQFVCSNCKESFCSSELTDEQFFEMMKFCPGCGANMKGDTNVC